MSPARATLSQGLCRRAALKTSALGTTNGPCRRWLHPRQALTGTAPRSLSGSRRPASHSTQASLGAAASAQASTPDARGPAGVYHGPLTQTFRRLKLFSLGSLGLTFTMTPFLFVVESSLPLSARAFLAATALSTSGISTALVGWCGAPYVVDLRRLAPLAENGIQGIEMTTLTLTLKKLTTRVYDADFLVATGRPFAKWELPLAIQLPPSTEDVVAAGKAGAPGEEETVAETFNDKGEVVGRWIVEWGEGGTGQCRGTGKVLRYFNVHEELL